jgi:hypothetical protein
VTHFLNLAHNWHTDLQQAPRNNYSRLTDSQPRTIWSLSNAFISALKELDPIPQFKATAKLGEFLESRFSQSF